MSYNKNAGAKWDIRWDALQTYNAEAATMENEHVTVEDSKDFITITLARAGNVKEPIEILPDGAALGRPGMLYKTNLQPNNTNLQVTVYVSAFPADTRYLLAISSPTVKSTKERLPAFKVVAPPSYDSGWQHFTTFGELKTMLGTKLRAGVDTLETASRARVDKLETEFQARVDKLETLSRARVDKLETEFRARVDKLEVDKLEVDKLETASRARVDKLETEFRARVDKLETEFRARSAEEVPAKASEHAPGGAGYPSTGWGPFVPGEAVILKANDISITESMLAAVIPKAHALYSKCANVLVNKKLSATVAALKAIFEDNQRLSKELQQLKPLARNIGEISSLLASKIVDADEQRARADKLEAELHKPRV
jgi:hypothetical protein